jgi:hypothetical protein
MARMAIRMLKAETPLAEIYSTRDAGVDHPLQGPVYGSATDIVVVRANHLYEIVSAQVSFLPKENADDEISLAGTAAARRPEALEVF